MSGSFFGTDGAEKRGSQTLQHGPQLDASASIERQAASLSAHLDRVDDLTFKESTVRDVSDRGRQKTVDDLMRSFAEAYTKVKEQKRIEPAGDAEVQTREEVCKYLAVLRGIRTTAANPRAAAEPLRKLATLPIDGQMLRKTKVALELNHDFWKKSISTEVKQMVVSLVREWKTKFRKEEDGPSERTLRNAAAALENAAHALAPRSAQYSGLVNTVVRRFAQVPDVAMSVLDGRQQPLDFVGQVHKRSIAEKNAEKKNSRPLEVRASSAPPEKRFRLEDKPPEEEKQAQCLPFVESQ